MIESATKGTAHGIFGALKAKISAFFELVVFQHSIFALPFLFIAASTAAWGFFGFRTLILALLAAVSARNFAMGFNRLIDRKYDAQNPRTATRPSVDGRISVAQMVIFCALNAAIFVGVGFLLNPLCAKISVPILFVLGFYSFVKRFSASAHLILGFCMGLAPVAGAAAVSGEVALWAWLLCFGVLFWGAGFDILYSLQDLEFDRTNALCSVPTRFGVNGALWISRAFHLFSVFCWGGFILLSHHGILAWCGLFVAALALLVEQIMVARSFLNIPRAFFTINGWVGFVFMGFCFADIAFLGA